MKKRLACILIACALLAAFSTALAAEGDVTVYVTVSIDGKLEVAAEPVTLPAADATVDGALKAAHEAFFPGGAAAGYAAGIDSMYNMFMISKAWGIQGTPYVLLNGEPLGYNPAVPATADAAPVASGDSILLNASSNPMAPSPVVSMTVYTDAAGMTVTAKLWTLDFMTFTYSSAPYADAAVMDPATGAALGVTDAEGRLTLTPPDSGIAAIDGLSAVRVDGSATEVAPPAAGAEPAPTELPKLDIGDEPLMDPPLIRFAVVGIIVLIPIGVAVIRNARKHVKQDREAGISQR